MTTTNKVERLSQDVPGNPAYSLKSVAESYLREGGRKPYVRIQRTRAERRANRLAGIAARRAATEVSA